MNRTVLTTAAGYAAFVALGVASRFFPVCFVLMVLAGLVLPIIAVRRERPARTLGYTRRNLRRSLLWAGGIGVLMGVLTIGLHGTRSQPLPGVQLVLGLVIWVAVMSPFQENVFRGWMQSRLEAAWGLRPALLTTSVAFAIWHLAPPLAGTSTTAINIASPAGLLSALVLGLLTGLARQRTQSMVGPWLGHALAGLALVATGQMTLLQYTE